MPLKRFIAREWLIFVLVFFLSPLVLGFYYWTTESWGSGWWSYPGPLYHQTLKDKSLDLFQPRRSTKAEQGEARWWGSDGGSHEFLAPTGDEAKALRQKFKGNPSDPSLNGRVRLAGDMFLVAKSADEAREFENLLVTGKYDPRLKGRFFMPPRAMEDSFKKAFSKAKRGETLSSDELQSLEDSGLELTNERRPLWGYLGAVVVDPNSYLGVIITYPLFLFMRSILWAIRTVKQ